MKLKIRDDETPECDFLMNAYKIGTSTESKLVDAFEYILLNVNN